MSYLRYSFAVFMIVIGAISTLLIGGLPQGEDPAKSFLFATGIYAAGLGIFISGFSKFRQLQLVRNTPTSKIRSIAIGNVELRVKPPRKMNCLNPLSATKNVFTTNIRINQIPYNFVTNALGYTDRELFEAIEEERQDIDISESFSS